MMCESYSHVYVAEWIEFVQKVLGSIPTARHLQIVKQSSFHYASACQVCVCVFST